MGVPDGEMTSSDDDRMHDLIQHTHALLQQGDAQGALQVPWTPPPPPITLPCCRADLIYCLECCEIHQNWWRKRYQVHSRSEGAAGARRR